MTSNNRDPNTNCLSNYNSCSIRLDKFQYKKSNIVYSRIHRVDSIIPTFLHTLSICWIMFNNIFTILDSTRECSSCVIWVVCLHPYMNFENYSSFLLKCHGCINTRGFSNRVCHRYHKVMWLKHKNYYRFLYSTMNYFFTQ